MSGNSQYLYFIVWSGSCSPAVIVVGHTVMKYVDIICDRCLLQRVDRSWIKCKKVFTRRKIECILLNIILYWACSPEVYHNIYMYIIILHQANIRVYCNVTIHIYTYYTAAASVSQSENSMKFLWKNKWKIYLYCEVKKKITYIHFILSHNHTYIFVHNIDMRYWYNISLYTANDFDIPP